MGAGRGANVFGEYSERKPSCILLVCLNGRDTSCIPEGYKKYTRNLHKMGKRAAEIYATHQDDPEPSRNFPALKRTQTWVMLFRGPSKTGHN